MHKCEEKRERERERERERGVIFVIFVMSKDFAHELTFVPFDF
jgi:hypothetical protein